MSAIKAPLEICTFKYTCAIVRTMHKNDFSNALGMFGYNNKSWRFELKFRLGKQSSGLKSSPSPGDLHQGLQLIECGFTSSSSCPGCLSRLQPVKMMYLTAAISQHIHIQIFSAILTADWLLK